MSLGPEPGGPNFQQLVTRVKVPAFLLITVGALNLFLGAGGLLRESITNLQMDEKTRKAKAAAIWDDMGEDSKRLARSNGMTKDTWVESTPTMDRITLIWGISATLGGLVVCYGAWQMNRLQSIIAARIGAIVACIPFVSCMGCMGIGQIVGIWAMVVLFGRDVSLLFETAAHPPMPMGPDEGGE